MMPEPAKERLAADRLEAERESYPSNNFSLSAAALAIVVALIVVLYALGVIKP